jgi:hypothetical protein
MKEFNLDKKQRFVRINKGLYEDEVYAVTSLDLKKALHDLKWELFKWVDNDDDRATIATIFNKHFGELAK